MCIGQPPGEGRGPVPNAAQNHAAGKTIKRPKKKKKKLTPGFMNKGKKHRDSDTAMHTQIKKNEEFSIVKGEMLLL